MCPYYSLGGWTNKWQSSQKIDTSEKIFSRKAGHLYYRNLNYPMDFISNNIIDY